MSLTILFLQIFVFFLIVAIAGRVLYKLHIHNIELVNQSHQALDQIYQLEVRLDLHESALMNEGIMNISWQDLIVQLNQIEENASKTKTNSPKRENNVYYINKPEEN